MNNILKRIDAYDAERAWLRQATFPEEDRRRHTSLAWRGEYRWFRAPNVVCLEKARAVVRVEHKDAA